MRSLLLFSLALSVVASPAIAAGKVKAKFACKKVLKDGSSWDIGKEGYKIEAERTDCSVQSKDSKLVGGMAVIKTAWTLGGVAHEGTERNGSPISEGGHYEFDFTLDRGTEWETCASEITIPVKVTDPSESWVFSLSDSGYGTFACAVFTRKGEEWRWTAVRTYEASP